jgi:beta-glucanase (GH16 family)
VKTILLSLAFITAAVAVEPPAEAAVAKVAEKIDLTKYKMTFSDEFDGNQLDLSKWEAPSMPRQGGSRWMPNMVSVKDGCLRLDIRLTDDPVLRYDCGAVRTQRNYDKNQTMFQQAFGYFEARCKMPRRVDADYFADFWLLANPDEGKNTTEGLEMDIFESFEFAEGRQHSVNFHWGGYGQQHNVYGLRCGDIPKLRDNDFHTYGLLWTESFYASYIDGVEVGRTDLMNLGTDKDGRLKSNGPCKIPAYLKLTVEAAGWPGKTNGWEPDAPKEDVFIIDWVHVYLPKTAEELAK